MSIEKHRQSLNGLESFSSDLVTRKDSSQTNKDAIKFDKEDSQRRIKLDTVMTPEALAKSKFKTCKLSEFASLDAVDEGFLFIFPSSDSINRFNGDGDLLEIHDFDEDFSMVYTNHGRHKTTPDTVVYYR